MGIVTGRLEVRPSRTLQIDFAAPSNADVIEVRLESDRNTKISAITDISARAPRIDGNPERGHGPEVWFPVVDVALEPGLEGVARFGRLIPTQCIVNPMFYKMKVPLQSTLILPAKNLEHWENAIYVESAQPILEAFYLRKQFVNVRQHLSHTFHLLTEHWSGWVSIWVIEPEGELELARYRVDSSPETRKAEAYLPDLCRDSLLQSLSATVEYTLRAINTNENSPTCGGLYLLYDAAARTFRASHWIWSWGVSIKLLLEASRVMDVTESHQQEMVDAAHTMGLRSLEFLVKDQEDPARNMVVVRQSVTPRWGYMYHPCVSPADSLFLAGWGWIPLYEKTGDKRYLEAAHNLAREIGRTNREFELVPQDYLPSEHRWKPFSINESGFGMEGLAEVHRVTRDNSILEIGRTYIDQHLDKLQNNDGTWERNWQQGRTRRYRATEDNDWTKGLGWAMEGLLAADRVLPGGPYLIWAKRMAEHLMMWQHHTGYWTARFMKSPSEVGICEKATALWTMLFYDLFSRTHNGKHLETARRGAHVVYW